MNVLGYLQKLGKAIMLPIAILPVAAILLRLGQPDMLNIAFMAQAGGAIFGQLPLLFAIGIAVGLSRGDAGAAGLAGAVGYLVLTEAAKTINADINMSFFGGIVAGVVAGHVYNRFHQTSLPAYLAFFGGKRLVPIMTGLITLILAGISGVVWPAIQHGIDSFGHTVAHSGAWGEFVYGTLNRALIPVGLHHVLNSIFWFGLGECTKVTYELVGGLHNLCLAPEVAKTLSVGGAISTIDGSVIQSIATETTRGDLNRFFAGDPSAGVFMTGYFPIMMFGLPGAAFAMYMAAPKSRRPQVGGILLSVALTAFLTGVTEPLEFLFMFLAPVLYIIHAILTGISLVVTNYLGILDGFGFSAGLFDFVINWGLATKPGLLLVVGLCFGVIYFCIFYFAIRWFDIPTPGREKDEATVRPSAASEDIQTLADEYIQALGGRDNLKQIDACITRLRLSVNNMAQIDEVKIKALGASGVVKLNRTDLQVVLGAKAELVANAMKGDAEYD
ncbi:PTS system glucose-specific EIICB component [Vibrio ruber DSM 16370]|uniref:PTS system glucose-specific EIICB component n=1 Tax=Vibrio ruber (strain DSM 16370 / JCM 11486 / BCRC 17186 / CECT 7878 / LMG 23124 / VR1) TaxID=1123498 RepID=A0A1R4LQN9_VIBR1|nr:N-acetylglucosamine-specific PTS transporter subunit IIBC [Vibrio ruber]SJN58699.1 PTS system glucose-specific EIICB component [Vibrio ruber DSM 16370]